MKHESRTSSYGHLAVTVTHLLQASGGGKVSEGCGGYYEIREQNLTLWTPCRDYNTLVAGFWRRKSI
jgi:hypothetical protein